MGLLRLKEGRIWWCCARKALTRAVNASSLSPSALVGSARPRMPLVMGSLSALKRIPWRILFRNCVGVMHVWMSEGQERWHMRDGRTCLFRSRTISLMVGR